MTEFLEATDADIAAGMPVTAELLAPGLRDNLIAFTEGAPGAPRLQAGAFADEEDFLIVVNASDDFNLGFGVEVTAGTTFTSSSGFVVAQTIEILSYTGTIRLSAVSDGSLTDRTARLTKEVGGVVTVLQAWTTDATGVGITRTIDVPIGVGDVLRWEHSALSDGGSSSLDSFTIRADKTLADRAVYRVEP